MGGQFKRRTQLASAIVSVVLLSACGAGTDVNDVTANVPQMGQAVPPSENTPSTTGDTQDMTAATAPAAPVNTPVQTPEVAPAPEPAPEEPAPETESEPATPIPIPVNPEPAPEPEPEPLPEPQPEPEPEPEPEPIPEPLPVEPPTEPEPAPPVNVSCAASANDVQASTLSLINQARASARSCGADVLEAAPPVTWNSQLAAAALKHSDDMATHDFFSHTGSDGLSVSQRVDAEQYNWRTVGENIAAGQSTTEIVIEAWLDSPGHCKNIMNPNFEEVAVVCVENNGSQYRQYWTNVLGTAF